MTPRQRKRYYTDYQRELDQAEAYAYARFKTLLTAQLSAVLRYLTANGVPVTYANVEQIITPSQTQKVFVQVMVKTGQQFARWIKPRLETTKADPTLGAGFFSQTFIDFMASYAVNEAGQHIKSITDTTRKLIKESLTDSAKNNYDIRKTARQLKAAAGGPITKNRAMLIARTETTSAANHGQYLTAKGFGIELQKEWIATRDGRTRDTHAAADGKIVDMEDYFSVGGSLMKYPGDPKGGAPNVCNCRCVVAFVPKAEAVEAVVAPVNNMVSDLLITELPTEIVAV